MSNKLLRGTGSPLDREYVELLLKAKDVKYVASEEETGGIVTLIDGDQTIIGAYPITEYLAERYPEPRLLLDTPAEKALVRMFLDRLFKVFQNQDKAEAKNVLTELLGTVQSKPYILSKNEPSVVDLAVTPLTRLVDGLQPAWVFHRATVMEALQCSRS